MVRHLNLSGGVTLLSGFTFSKHINAVCIGRNEICSASVAPCASITEQASCEYACSVDSSCVSYEWLSVNTCQMSTSCTLGLSVSGPDILAIKKPRGKFVLIAGSYDNETSYGFSKHTNTGCIGRNEICNASVAPCASITDIASCEYACSVNSSCVSYEWLSVNKTCQMYYHAL